MKKESFEEFCRLCIPLLKSGYSVSRAAGVISRMGTAPRQVLAFARYLMFMMQTGCSFTYASERYYTGLKNGGYGALFHVFELTGNLQKAMELYVVQQEQDKNLNRKLAGALLYPALVLLGLMILCIFLVANSELFGLASGIQQMTRTVARAGALFICWLIGFCIWITSVFRVNQKEQFYRLMAAGLATHTDLVTCLRLCALSQTSLSSSLARVTQLVQEGIPLAAALKREKPFSRDDFSLLELAGDNRQLSEAFQDYADALTNRNREKQERTLNLIEPVLLTGVGAVILLVSRDAILPYLTAYGGML